MKKSDNIFIAGHKGLVGNAVYRLLKKKGFKNLITIDKKKLDLRNSNLVDNFFKNKNIDYMVMAAARAGGIIANSSNQKDFFLDNIEIQNSLLKLALKKKNKKNNLFRHIMYLSKISEGAYCRRQSVNWKVRKNKPMLCNS